MSLGYFSAEAYPITNLETARRHFKQHGHVAVRGVYVPEIAPGVISDIRGEAGLIYISRSGREQTARAQLSPDASRQPNLRELLAGMHAVAQQLEPGRHILPDVDEQLRLQIIDMQAGAEGMTHYDRDGAYHTVGITTVEGASTLIADDFEYQLAPGIVAFLDHDRRVLHGGSAVGPTGRIGIVAFAEGRIAA